MESGLPIYLYIDNDLVDQLWALIKREAVPTERVKEASAKAAAKAKFGFGHILSWLAADVSGELGIDGSIKQTDHLQYTALLKSLLLKELLPSLTKTIDFNASASAKGFPLDAFVEIECEHVVIVSLPTAAAFTRQLSLYVLGKSLEDQEKTTSELETMAYVERLTVSEKAFDIVLKIMDNDDKSILKRLWDSFDSIIYNATSMSNNDHIMLVGIPVSSPESIVYSIVKEEGLRRNIGAYTGSRRISIFGQAASCDRLPEQGMCLGIAPVAITLG